MPNDVMIASVLMAELRKFLEPISFLAVTGRIEVTYNYETESTEEFPLNEVAEDIWSFLADGGIELPELPTEQAAADLVTAISAAETAISGAVEAIETQSAGIDDIEALIAAVEAIRGFIVGLDALRVQLANTVSSIPPADDVAKLVTEHLIAVYLSRYYPAVWQVLCFLGVGNDAALNAGTDGQFDFARIA
ncbi:MAG: hypothetical protein HWD84_09940, partial [Flavobacteriaceae bacterium]|nr:hypothetical protein [Flavobacteriaceae bacterium]